jgi:hypothetical protein
MHRDTTVPRSRPALEALEGRDLPSGLPALAQSYLVPLAQQEAAASTASLARLQTANTALAAIQAGTSHPTSDQAAQLYAQAASAYQDVLTERRALELSFLSILDFFGAAIMQGGDFANDLVAFQQLEINQLNPPRQTVIANENTANALAIVTTGVNTAPGANGQFVFATDASDNTKMPVVEINYPALLPSKGAGIVTAPQFDYSQAVWPLAYSPTGVYLGGSLPSNNP